MELAQELITTTHKSVLADTLSTHTQRKLPQNTLTSFVDYTKCIQSSLFRSLNNYQHKVHLCKYIQNPQTHSNVEYYKV